MTYKQLFELLPKLDSFKELVGAEFAYNIIYNKRMISQIYKDYEEMKKPSKEYEQYLKDRDLIPLNYIQSNDEYKKYDEERVNICLQYCDKDNNDKPIINNNAFQITTNIDSFRMDLENLNSKHKQCLQQYNQYLIDKNKELNEIYKENINIYIQQQQSINNFLNSDCSAEFHIIDKKYIPQNISMEQLELIMDWIN